MDDKKWDERAGSDGGREVELRSRPTSRNLAGGQLPYAGTLSAYISVAHASGVRIRHLASLTEHNVSIVPVPLSLPHLYNTKRIVTPPPTPNPNHHARFHVTAEQKACVVLIRLHPFPPRT